MKVSNNLTLRNIPVYKLIGVKMESDIYFYRNIVNVLITVCCKDGWKLIFAGSRFTKPAESRYSPTEGEALAVAWALQHSRMYTLGCSDLLIAVDHKPLLGIFNTRNLGDISNPRIQGIKQRSLAWQFSIVYCPGKWTRGPDALSRQNISSTLAFIKDEQSYIDGSTSTIFPYLSHFFPLFWLWTTISELTGNGSKSFT